QRGDVDVVETARVDADLIGVGARHVKGVNAAMAAEGVMCGSGIEPIGRQLPLSTEQLEAAERHGKMQDARFRPDRAVAFADRAEIGPDANPYSTAMAATRIGFEHRPSSINE